MITIWGLSCKKVMKRVIKRIAAFLIAFCTVFSAVPLDGIGPIRVKAEEGDYVSKLEWLDALTKAFQLEVEEENYPDDYFSDSDTLSSDEYYILMLATEFGLVDTEAGEAVNAKEDVTREYVAHTMNVCMGVVREGTEYTFSESDTVTYPDDIEVAIEQGWLTLSNGYFYPEKGITTSEVSSILSYAETELEEQKIVENYNSQYQLKDDIIVIPSDVEVVLSDDDELTFTNLPTDVVLQSGSKFAVISNGLPIVRKVVSIANSETETIVKVESVEPADAFISADVQGTINGELADAKLTADSSVMSYIVGGTENEYFEDGQEYLSLKDTENNQLSAVKVVQSYEIPEAVRKAYNLSDGVTADISCTVSNVYADYKVSKSLAYLNVNMTVTFQCNVSVDVLKEIGISGSITLVKIPIETIGFATVTLDLKFAGKITVNLVEDVSAGVKWSKDSGVNLTRNFTKKAFTIQSRAEISAGVTVSADANIGFIKGKIYAKIGAKASVDSDVYTDGNTPTMCSQIYAYLYASVGCEVSLDVTIGFVTFYKKTWSQSYTIWDKNNSPVRVSFHFEDGKAVSRCTRTYKSDGKTPTNTYYKYYTPADSRYGYNGSSSGIGSDGNEYAIFDYQVLTDGTLEITGYHGNMSCLSIPDELDGRKVTSIGSYVFQNNNKLEYVIIPDSIINIGNGAFYSCKNVKNICLSKNLKSLGAKAFAECNSLKGIEIPKSLEKAGGFGHSLYTDGPFAHCDNFETVTFEEGTTHVAQYLFAHCTGLKKIKIPDTVTSIDYSAFDSCVNLKEIQLGSKISEIEGEAFRYCVSLEEITIPGSVNTLGEYSFAYCNGLKEIIMPDSITEVKKVAFYSCGSLEKVVLSKNLKSLGARAFADCNAIKEIEIPKSLEKAYGYSHDVGSYYSSKYYEDGPFAHCDNLETVTFEEGTTHVAQYLFGHCTGLKKIKIPDTVTSIDYCAFNSCVNLKEIQLGSRISEIGGFAFENCVSFEKITIPDSVNTLGEYSFAYCNGLKEIIMPDSITEVKKVAFYSCGSLEKVVLSKNLKSLGVQAFADCNAIKEIEIPKSLEKATGGWHYVGSICYEDGPFAHCDNLEIVTFEEGTTHVAQYLFAHCTGLKKIKIPDTVTSIDYSAFDSCVNLKEIQLGSKISEIEGEAFRYCVSLEEITIPDSVNTLGEYSFAYCNGLKEIIMPDSITEVKWNAFYSCESLGKVVLSKNLKNLEAEAFAECNSLIEITIPDAVEVISMGLLSECESLEKVCLGDSVTAIYSDAFSNCKALHDIVLPDSLSQIGSQVFYKCEALESISIPNSVQSVGDSIFKGCITLKDVHIGWGVKSISSEMFSDCAALEDIVIPYNVLEIKSNAFKNDTNLVSVIIPQKTASIATDAFSYPDKMTIYGVEGSYAETYANQKGIKFVNQTISATKVELDSSEYVLYTGEQIRLIPIITPSNFTDLITYRSADEKIATVSEDGVVKAKSAGKITVKVIVGGVSTSCTIEVRQKVTYVDIYNVSLNMAVNEEEQLEVDVGPDNAYNKEVLWSSSDETVATVSQDGLVTAMGKGTCQIKATAMDGSGKYDTVNATVDRVMHFVDSIEQLESTHPYEASCKDIWIYSVEGAESIDVTFSEDTYVEDGFDKINILDSYGNVYQSYTGSELAGKTITINEDTLRIQLVSDEQTNGYGFKVVDIKADTSEQECKHDGATYLVGSVEATCSHEGYTGDVYCKKCNQKISSGTSIAKKPHSWNSGSNYYNNKEAGVLYTCKVCGETKSVRNGKFTSLAKADDGNWYDYVNGLVSTYTGLRYYNGSWWYVEKGKINFGATTLCLYGGTWWYVEKGKVNFGATTLCLYNGTWWYVEKGKVNFGATTLCQYGGSWWYVQKGKVNFGATTLCQYGGSWWYVQKGKVNFGATTLCNYGGTWWYVQKGKVNFGATTLCQYGGSWWYVEKGKVNFNATTLCNYGGKWWYVQKGKVNFGATTLCKYSGTWWYVEKGAVNFNYTGYFKYYGTNYRIVKGVVKF